MKLQKMSCPNCNGKLDIDVGDKEYIFCPFCGEKFKVDDGKIECTINKNININKNVNYTNRTIDETEIEIEKLKQEESKRNDKIFFIYMGSLILLILILVFGFRISDKISDRKTQKAIDAGKISAGYYEDYKDTDYAAVVKQFETFGFENITTVDLEDAGLAIWNNGKVESITINGDATFYRTDFFDPDDPVVITYH